MPFRVLVSDGGHVAHAGMSADDAEALMAVRDRRGTSAGQQQNGRRAARADGGGAPVEALLDSTGDRGGWRFGLLLGAGARATEELLVWTRVRRGRSQSGDGQGTGDGVAKTRTAGRLDGHEGLLLAGMKDLDSLRSGGREPVNPRLIARAGLE